MRRCFLGILDKKTTGHLTAEQLAHINDSEELEEDEAPKPQKNRKGQP